VVWEYDIEDGKKEISPLLLIPFVENAFKHVSRPYTGIGYVIITLVQKTNTLSLTVENSILQSSRTTENSKKQPKKTVVIDKETRIKSDIINNVPKEKILQKFSVTERTYYNKLKSVREIQIKKSQTILTKIADENYNDLKEQLLELENEKRKLKEKFLEIGLDDDETLKRINTRLKVLKEFEKEIYKGGQIVGSYRQAELEMELENENIQKEKLEIEKSKLNTDINEDNKIEIKLVGI